MNDLEEAITEALEPLLRRLVREEVERAQLQWRWRSVKQTAELLDTTEAAILKQIQRGQLRSELRGNRRFVDIEALDRQMRRLR